jgi:hypothetical protein
VADVVARASDLGILPGKGKADSGDGRSTRVDHIREQFETLARQYDQLAANAEVFGGH